MSSTHITDLARVDSWLSVVGSNGTHEFLWLSDSQLDALGVLDEQPDTPAVRAQRDAIYAAGTRRIVAETPAGRFMLLAQLLARCPPKGWTLHGDTWSYDWPADMTPEAFKALSSADRKRLRGEDRPPRWRCQVFVDVEGSVKRLVTPLVEGVMDVRRELNAGHTLAHLLQAETAWNPVPWDAALARTIAFWLHTGCVLPGGAWPVSCLDAVFRVLVVEGFLSDTPRDYANFAKAARFPPTYEAKPLGFYTLDRNCELFVYFNGSRLVMEVKPEHDVKSSIDRNDRCAKASQCLARLIEQCLVEFR